MEESYKQILVSWENEGSSYSRGIEIEGSNVANKKKHFFIDKTRESALGAAVELETLQTVQKLSRLFGNFSDCSESFQTV